MPENGRKFTYEIVKGASVIARGSADLRPDKTIFLKELPDDLFREPQKMPKGGINEHTNMTSITADYRISVRLNGNFPITYGPSATITSSIDPEGQSLKKL